MFTNFLKAISIKQFCFYRQLSLAIILMMFLPFKSYADFIEFEVVEFKGHFVIPGVPETKIQIVDSGMLPNTPDHLIKRKFNLEEVEIEGSAVDIEFDLYNIYTEYIEIPELPPVIPPYDLFNVDFYWVMAADFGSGIGGLNDRMTLTAASLFGDSGTEFEATITSMNDLANLPTISSQGLEVSWDLSAIAQTTGNFYLAHAVLPSSEVFSVSEPKTLIIFFVLASLFNVYRRTKVGERAV